MIRLLLTDGGEALFHDMLDLFNFVLERMMLAGEL